MKSEVAFFKDKRANTAEHIIRCYRFFGFTDKEIINEMKKIIALRKDNLKVGSEYDQTLELLEPSPSDVSVTQDVSINNETPQSVENTNPDYYKDELYLDEDFRMLAKTYPADVSAIGVTTLIDYVEAVEAELARRDEVIARLTIECDAMAEENRVLSERIQRLVDWHVRAEKAEAVINGMFPMWIAAMSYCEHGRAAALDRMRNYYNGRDNPLTSDELHALFEIQKPIQKPEEGEE